MRMLLNEGKIKGHKASRSGPQISQLFFADDFILFDDPTREGAEAIKIVLKES